MINENAVIKTKERQFTATSHDTTFDVRKGTNNILNFELWTMDDSDGEIYISIEFTKTDTEKFLDWINATTF